MKSKMKWHSMLDAIRLVAILILVMIVAYFVVSSMMSCLKYLLFISFAHLKVEL